MANNQHSEINVLHKNRTNDNWMFQLVKLHIYN